MRKFGPAKISHYAVSFLSSKDASCKNFLPNFGSTGPFTPLALLVGELDANRPVPFRLTPSLQSLISPIGVTGPLQMSMVAASRCLVQPQYSLHSILRAILRDEFITWCKVRSVTIYLI